MHRRRWLAAAAAVVLIGGAVAVGLATADDSPEKVDRPTRTTAAPIPPTSAAPDPTVTTSGSEPGDSSPTTVPDPAGAAQPGRLAAIVDGDGDGLGDVVLIDVATGAVVKAIYEAPPPQGSEEEGGSAGAYSLDVSADGVVYYEICCEPAVGVVMGYDTRTDQDLGMVAFGTQPTVSPDGTELAVALTDGQFGIVDLLADDGATDDRGYEPPAGFSELMTDLAWSADGSILAIEVLRYRSDGSYEGVRVRLLALATGDVVDVGLGDDPERFSMPAFRSDGTLLLGLDGLAEDPGSPISASGIGTYSTDLATLTGPEIDAAGLMGLDATADGSFVLARLSDGSLGVIEGDGGAIAMETLPAGPPGIVAAAW